MGEIELRPGEVVATTLRRATAAGLHASTAIFFTRTRIVDGSGRLVEDLVVPIEVRCPSEATRIRRCRLPQQLQTLFDGWLGQVRTACLTEVASRITNLASAYGQGLQRARTREAQLLKLANNRRSALVQQGLFDRRGKRQQAATSHGRTEAFDAASSLLVAQQSEVVLLLVISSST